MERLRLIKNKKGQSLVEILIAMGLMAVFLPALLTGFVASREAKPQKAKRFDASQLIREAEEAVISAKESSWDNVSTNGTFYPVESGNEWDLTSGTESTPEGFLRSITISDVQRNINGDIVTSGGTVDPATKRLDISVSWTQPIASSATSTLYLTKYSGNTTWVQDTQAEFALGTNVNVSVVNNVDGEVELTESTGGTWTSPGIVDDYDSPNNTDGYAVFAQGNYLFLGTEDLEILDISDPFNVTLVGAVDVGSTVIYDIFVDGNYAYLATNNDEFTVVDVTNKTSPTVADTLNLTRGNDAYSVWKAGNYAYLGRDKSNTSEFYSIDVSNPNNVSEADSIEVGDDVNGVAVQGNYAYLANDGTELRIVDISNPNSLSFSGSYDSPGNTNGEAIAVSGSYAYLGTATNGGGDELYIINVSNPASPSLVGSYEVGGEVNGIFVSGDYVFLATDKPSGEFQVIDVTNKASPVLYGQTSINKSTHDVVVSGNYAYLGVADQTREAIIIEGGFGSGGNDYQTNGTYESQTFNAGGQVFFNHISFTATEPTNTDITMQIATNNDGSTWNFVGPDGTGGSYFDNEGGIPLDYILGQYFRFKAYLTGDGSDTPILEDVTLNYTP